MKTQQKLERLYDLVTEPEQGEIREYWIVFEFKEILEQLKAIDLGKKGNRAVLATLHSRDFTRDSVKRVLDEVNSSLSSPVPFI